MRNGIGKTKQYNLIMSEELYDRLKSVCKAADVRMSEIIRQKKMRACSVLLPDPGGEVVRECLDEIERLRGVVADIINLIGALQRDLV